MRRIIVLLPAILLSACSIGMVLQEGSVTPRPVRERASAGGVVCEATGRYPTVSNLMSRQVEVNINGYFDDFAYRVKRDVEHCPEFFADLVTEDSVLKDTTTVEYGVKRLDRQYLSIVLTRTQQLEGAAHPNIMIEPFTFGLEDGQPIALAGLFREETAYETLLTDRVQEALVDANLNSAYPSELSKPLGQYYLTPTHLVLVDLFEAHALRGFSVEIPLEDLREILITPPQPAST